MWLVDLDAGTAEAILADLDGGSTVVWSADGERLAFHSDPGSEAGAGQVYVVHPDGSGLAALTDHESGRVTGLAWRSQGETLVYGLSGSEDADREDGLYELDPFTGEVIRSLAGPGLTPIGFDATGEFLAFEDGSDLLVWVLAFGQVLPASAGGAGGGFIGFVGGADS
jgi:Tol biopolymer transport system component